MANSTKALAPKTSSKTASPEAGTSPRQELWGKLWFGFACALVVAAIFVPRGDGTSSAPGGFLLDATGRPTTMGNHMTPVVLVHFWATWCPPCITEIPALQRLAEEFTGQAGFQVMMIAVDDELENVRPFVGQRAFQVLYDPEWDIAHRYGTYKLPETYLVVNGRVLHDFKFVGATDWDDPKIRERLEKVIDLVGEGRPLKELKI